MLREDFMEKVPVFLCLLVLTVLAQHSTAQPLTDTELQERGEMTLHGGYMPKSLESLVGVAALIVKGRFGEHLNHRWYWGYSTEAGRDRTPEEAAAIFDVTVDELYNDRHGLPMSEYEIFVDEVLYGELQDSRIIFREYEAAPSDRSLTNPATERLFFLVMSPDNETYTIHYSSPGRVSILSDEDGVYYYDEIEVIIPTEENPFFVENIHKRVFDFMPTMEVEAFEELLFEEIDKRKAREAKPGL